MTNDFNIFADLDAQMEEIPTIDESADQNQSDFDLLNNLDDTTNSSNENSETSEQSADYLTEFLKTRGIDKNKILIQTETGEQEEVTFDDLTDEEKLFILNSTNDSAISDSELETLNYLRRNKMNLQDFAKWQKEEAIKEYLEQNQTTDYTVNKLSDDELYIYDLMDRYPDLTEEEAQSELESAKVNETLFAKKIQAIRNEYTNLEDEQNKQKEDEAKAAKEQEFDNFARSLVDIAKDTNELHDITIEDSDKDEILTYLLDRDANGQSEFYKVFSDPRQLFKMAWYMKFGDQAFKAINDYYKGVIEKTRRTQSQPKTITRKVVTATDEFDLENQYKLI